MSAYTTKPFSAVRAICIGSVLLVVGAFWVVVQEILLNAGNISANAPPVGAVGLFLGVLTIAVLLGIIRRRWALDRRELLLIYCMLITFFPLASQGLWQRFVGTMISARTFTSYNHVDAGLHGPARHRLSGMAITN